MIFPHTPPVSRLRVCSALALIQAHCPARRTETRSGEDQLALGLLAREQCQSALSYDQATLGLTPDQPGRQDE